MRDNKESIASVMLVFLLAFLSLLAMTCQMPRIPKFLGHDLGEKTEVLTHKTIFQEHNGFVDLYINESEEVQAMIFETENKLSLQEVKVLRNALFEYFDTKNSLKFEENSLMYYTYKAKKYTVIFTAYADNDEDYTVSITYKLK